MAANHLLANKGEPLVVWASGSSQVDKHFCMDRWARIMQTWRSSPKHRIDGLSPRILQTTAIDSAHYGWAHICGAALRR